MNPGLFSFLKLATPKIQEKLDQHFDTSGDGKKWTAFKQNLRSKGFAEAAKSDPRADEKLKKYVEMVHLHKTGKGPTFPVKSDDSNKRYVVKYHPSVERFTCSCPDWTIKHSVDGGDCKHIKKLKSQSSMVKKAGLALREMAGLGRVLGMKARTEGNNEQAWHAGEVNRVHRNVSQERKLRRPG